MTAKFNLVLDSSCDLPREFYDRPGIGIARLTYTYDGSEDFYDNLFEDVSPHDFYEKMRAGATPKTSQVSQGEFHRVFSEALEDGLPVVYLAFSSAISGTYEAGVLAAKQIMDERGDGVPIYCVDTKTASTGLTVLSAEAIRQRERGLTAEEMVQWAEQMRYFCHIIFMVDNLDALHRGGRIPASVAVAGAKLDVKPLLTIALDGSLQIIGVARGRKKAIKKMCDFYFKHRGETPTMPVFLGNADCMKDVEKLAETIADADECTSFVYSNIGPVIGCHVGPGMMACCFFGEDRHGELSVSDRIANRIKHS